MRKNQILNDTLIGLIPCAGKATRLNYPIAKELWPVQSSNTLVPLIQNVMYHMYDADCTHQMFIVRADKPEIMQYVSLVDDLYIHKVYICQTKSNKEGKSSGLVDAIDSAYYYIRKKIVLFGMPDTYIEAENPFQQILPYVQNGQADIAFGLFETDTPEKFGIVDFDDDFKAISVKDKQEHSGKYMWGILAWSEQFTQFLHQMHALQENDFASILNRAISHGYKTKVHVIQDKQQVQGKYWDFGTQEDIIAFNNRNAK